jgi:hypothetical protein
MSMAMASNHDAVNWRKLLVIGLLVLSGEAHAGWERAEGTASVDAVEYINRLTIHKGQNGYKV